MKKYNFKHHILIVKKIKYRKLNKNQTIIADIDE